MGETEKDLIMDINFSDAYSNKKVLVTGAAGFLGSHLISRLLSLGARVWLFVRDIPQVYKWQLDGIRLSSREVEDVIIGDFCNYDSSERAICESMPDIVFHCGAMTQVGQSRIMPLQGYRSNVMGTINLLEALRRNHKECSIIVASSDKAYGDSKLLLTENSIPNPIHPYDTSKAMAELAAKSYGEYYQMNVVITECGNIYGPGDTNWQRLIPGIFRDIINGRQPIIRSDGKQIRDYNYITDIVNAYLLIGRNSSMLNYHGQKYIISSGNHLEVADLVLRMYVTTRQFSFNPETPLILNQAKDESPQLILDGSKFKDEFCWQPEISIDSGLRKTFLWLSKTGV